jgi:hypothetical protein
MKSVMIEKEVVELPVIRNGNLVRLNIRMYDEATKPYVVLVTKADTGSVSGNFEGTIVYSESISMGVGYTTSKFISDSFVQFNGTITLEA